MQTVANLAKKLDLGPEEALEALRYMLYEVESVDSEISDEECDLLIEYDEDRSVAERVRDAKLKEQKKQEQAAKKAAQKRKAEEKKRAAEKAEREEAERAEAAAKEAAAKEAAAKEAAAKEAAAKAAAAKEAAASEAAAQEAAAQAEVEASKETAEVVAAEAAAAESAVAEPVQPAPVAQIVPAEAAQPPVAEVEPAAAQQPEAEKKVKKYAEILPDKPKEKGPSIIIGSAIDHDANRVEVLRADGTRVDIPEAEAIGVGEGAEEEEEEESGLLAEAQRRQEEEEKRRAKVPARPLPQPDPAVVAEVIRKAAERSQKQKKEIAKPAKPQKVEKAQRAERVPVAPVEDERPQRRGGGGGGATGKTARKRIKRAEKERAEEIMRRDAAIAVREYQTGGMMGGAPRRHKRKRTHEEVAANQTTETPEILEVEDRMTVEELALAMDVSVNDIILDLMDHNVLATKTQMLGLDVIRLVAEARGFEIRTVIPEEEAALIEEPDNPEDMVPRSPVITVMGHVDHGKTTLLDSVRSANVAEGEAGGITQHIAAYDVPIKSGRVVFLDTPGHEAFTQMRARGSKATDIVVLVVAADDGVMPQTIEAIDHAKAAEVPIVVAINKCDKPDAQPDRIRQELTQFGLVDEQWGGKTIMKNISAKNKIGVDELMELLLLEAELLELKANPKKRAQGVVVESEITRGMGPVAWVLVQNGTLRVGDFFLAGETHGRVRTLQNSRGEQVQEAGPATPVVVTGFNEPPEAGTSFTVVTDERVARAIAERRAELSKQKGTAAKHITLEDFHERLMAGEKSELRVVLKADVQGSVDVLSTSLSKLGNEEVRVDLVHGGVGGINESDVMLASASDAVILGFHVVASAKVKKLAEQEGVDIRTYRVIYEAIADVKAALEGMLAPESKETVVGHIEIRAVFRSSTFGNVAGCYVLDGEIPRGSQVRLTRDGIVVYTGRISTLRRGKEDVRTVTAGLECGIKLENYEDIKEGDVIEAFKVEQVAKALA